MARHIASEKARAQWRELLDAVADGEEIVIERYGRPVAVLSHYRAEAPKTGMIRESAPMYDATAVAQLKAEIVAEVVEQFSTAESERRSWSEELDELRASIAAHGGLGYGDDPEAIVEQMRKTRQEIFDAEYAHLYR